MKRYEHFCSYDGGGMGQPEETVDGDWVRYEDAKAELEQLRAMLMPLLLLAQEVRLIDAHGATPDGDGVNGPTALWAEDWTRRLATKEAQ